MALCWFCVGGWYFICVRYDDCNDFVQDLKRSVFYGKIC